MRMISVSSAPIENRFKLKPVSGCWKIQEIIGVNIIEAAEIPVTNAWPGLFPKRGDAIRRIEQTLNIKLSDNQIRKIAY